MDLAPRTRSILLLHGFVTLIDEADWPAIRHLSLYRGNTGYVYYSVRGSKARGEAHVRTLHSFLLGDHPSMHTDHVNGDKLDNRRANLRIVTPAVNGQNRQGLNRNNKSGVRGVHWHADTGKWQVLIRINKRTHHVGLFVTLEDAAKARRDAESMYYKTASTV